MKKCFRSIEKGMMMKSLAISFFVGASFMASISHADICDRVLKESIYSALQKLDSNYAVKPCSRITAQDLLRIESIRITSDVQNYKLARKDFEGLSNLKQINVYSFKVPFASPDDVFADLPLLTKASYYGSASGLSILSAATNLETLTVELGDTQGTTNPALLQVEGSDFLKLKKLKHLEMSAKLAPSVWRPYELVSLPFDQCSSLESFRLSEIKVGKQLDLLGEATRIGRCHGNSKATLKVLSLKRLHLENPLSIETMSPDSAIMDMALGYDSVSDFNQFISNLPALSSLTTWDYGMAAPENAKQVFEIKDHANLETLKVSFSYRNTAFARLPKLKNLTLEGSGGFAPVGGAYFGNIDFIDLPNLLDLRLKVWGVNELSFQNTNWPQGLTLGYKYLKNIPKFYGVKGVKTLDLSRNAITDVPSDYGATLPADLEELNLCENPLSNPQSLWNLIKGYPEGAHFKIKVTTAKGCEYLNLQ